MNVSSATDPSALVQAPRAAARASGASLFHSPGAMLLLGIVLGVCFGWRNITAVWSTGKFFDTDDAMHMVQVREWMAGQDWFDMTATRMDPPYGVAMHWTRVTDIPIALIARFFGLFLAPDMAERVMRIVYSGLLQAAFVATIVSLARKLVGVRGIGVAVILAVTSAALFGQLEPGRLSHQNVQVVLMMVLLRALTDIFAPRRIWSCIAVGALSALSLSISLEDLPFIAVAIAVAGGVWIARGPTMARQLAWIGASLAIACLAAFVATVPPAHYGLEACDAFSGAHLIAAMVGGLGFCVLAGASGLLAGPWQRAVGAGVAGGLALGAVALTFPACLGDPFGAVDPLVRRVWLHHVSESQPLGSLLLHHLLDNLPIAAPLFVGLVALSMAIVREQADSRMRWIAVAAFAAMGVAGAFWQVRMASYAGCVTMFGGVWLFVHLSRSNRWSERLCPFLAGLAVVPFSAVAWAVTVPSEPSPKSAFGDGEACFSAAAFKALDVLPQGVIFAGIDPGPFILAHTGHSVVTGPYHRDNRGLRLSIDAMLGDAHVAHQRIAASGATYVVLCPASKEIASYVEEAPDGFAAQLRRGTVPTWLKPVDVKGTAYRVYRVTR